MKRLLDLLLSITALILLIIPGVIIAVCIVLDSKGGVFFKQERVGRFGHPFRLYKFRSMTSKAEKAGKLTVGSRDNRVTRVGHFLRQNKLDELPQLLNIIKGEMSIVGPRPEVPEFVAFYTNDQKEILKMRPGLTSLASLAYFEESRLLAESDDPQKTYIEEIMPAKLALDMPYLVEQSFFGDCRLILRTARRIISKK